VSYEKGGGHAALENAPGVSHFPTQLPRHLRFMELSVFVVPSALMRYRNDKEEMTNMMAG
jgi:hypothetical protein